MWHGYLFKRKTHRADAFLLAEAGAYHIREYPVKNVQESDHQMASVSFFREPGWVMIYPVYLNKKLTIQQGRKLPGSKAVEEPTSQEIYEACKRLGYAEALIKHEPLKAYSRDYTQRGRVQVRIKKENGDLYNESVASRKVLNTLVANMIRELPSRKGGQAGASRASASSSSNAASASSPSSASEEKGKKAGKKGKK